MLLAEGMPYNYASANRKPEYNRMFFTIFSDCIGSLLVGGKALYYFLYQGVQCRANGCHAIFFFSLLSFLKVINVWSEFFFNLYKNIS